MAGIQQVLLTVKAVADTCTIGRGVVLAWTPAMPTELGRHPECGLHLPDHTVSRRHVRLSLDSGRILVEPLTQSNGTFLDGEALKPGDISVIASGSTLQVGGVMLQVQLLHATVPVVDALSLVPESTDAQQAEGLSFRVVWDADNCVVELNGRQLELPPTPARALGVLLEAAPDVVHQWDLLEHLGENTNLAQVFSQVRSSLLACVDGGELSLDLLRQCVRRHTSGEHAELDSADARVVLRHLVASRRGFGYRICVASTDVCVERL